MIAPAAIGRLALGAAASALLLAGLARASAAPLPLRGAESARIRLSFNARPERIEVCREVSAQELAEREEHMRQRVECDGRFATYALRVDADGRPLDEAVVRGAGLRHDRPLYLLRELSLAPGTHHIAVSFVRREQVEDKEEVFEKVEAEHDADTGVFAGRARREAIEHSRRVRAAIPPRLTLDTTLALAAGQVVVVSLDPERQRLRLIGAPQPR